MTEGPSRNPQLTPEELLIAQILHEENGEQVDFTDLQHLKPGDRIRIYRIAPGDINNGRAAVLEMELKRIGKLNWQLIFKGKYISSKPTSETIDIPSGSLIISTTGKLQIFAGGLGMHTGQWLLLEITNERVLIFVEKNETGALKRISDVRAGVSGSALEPLRIG